MQLSLEIQFIVRVALVVVRRHSTGLPLARGMSTHRGLRARRTHKGTPRNLGGLPLPSKCGRVTRGTNPGSRSGSRSTRANTRADDGTAARGERSVCGTSEQMSELRVVPVKWGNHPEGPHGGKATGAGYGNHWRER